MQNYSTRQTQSQIGYRIRDFQLAKKKFGSKRAAKSPQTYEAQRAIPVYVSSMRMFFLSE